ncbi:MAG: hypothetical protein AMXMBFR57_15630 [Acidimicrobiia bacterium]|jgi:hypothetical protein
MTLGTGEWLVLAPVLLMVLVPLVLTVVAAVMVFRSLGRRRREFGYATLQQYLRAAPATDAEKRDATDLMLKGVVVCVLGILFPPAILLGVVPLFYGTRKVCYASMGLGLIDDAGDRHAG